MGSNLHNRITYYRLRARQLVDRSRVTIRKRGVVAFLKQTYRWLVLGQRTYAGEGAEGTRFASATKVLNLHGRYLQWLPGHLPTPDELARQRAHAFDYQPLLSVVIPVYNPPRAVFDAALGSILAQTYSHFEVCLANAGRRAPIEAAVRALGDARLRLEHLGENAGIAGNTNVAIGMAAGAFVIFMDHDDRLSPQALYRVVEALNADPTLDILYSDYDKLGEDGLRYHPLLKPDWSPEMLHNGMYTGHMSAYRRTLLERVGGLRPAFDGAQDYDLILRASEVTDRIHHLPYLLYQWRAIEGSAAADGKPEARRANVAALEAAVARRGYQGEVQALRYANRIHFQHPTSPLVSIIIPTDDERNARAALKALQAKTDYPHWEAVVVTNSPLAARLEALGMPNLRCVRYDGPFNFSLKCNQGAEAAAGDYLLFLNDDVAPLKADWLGAMMQYAQLPGIGGVSGKLLYTNDTIQYAGMVTNVRDFVGTSFHTWAADDQRAYGIANWVRNVSILTGACLLTPARAFEGVGGWDAERAPIANSDLDLSFKLAEAGYRLVYTPHAELRHVGHVSIGRVDGGERRFDDSHLYMLARWGDRLSYDPYFPPNMRDLFYPHVEGFAVHAERSPANQRALQSGARRLLLVSHDLSLSGAPIILLELARHLKREGAFLTVVAPSDGPLRAEYRALDIPVIIDPLVLEAPEAVAPLYHPFDLIVPNTVFGWPVVQAAHRAGKRALWLVHEPHFGVKAINLWGREAKRAFSLAAAVVYPAHSARAMYSEWAGDNRHEVVYYGITDPRPGAPTAPLPPDRLNLVCVGTIEDRKGVDALIAMLDALPPAARERIHVTFVGRFLFPEFAARMQAAAAHLPFVTFTGQVPHAEALAYTRACDIYLCASRDETGPIVVIEALALGKPVVTTDVGAVGELIDSGVEGFVVDVDDMQAFGDRLVRLIEDPGLRERMGTAARRLYERQFHSGRYARDLAALVDALIDAPAPARATT